MFKSNQVCLFSSDLPRSFIYRCRETERQSESSGEYWIRTENRIQSKESLEKLQRERQRKRGKIVSVGGDWIRGNGERTATSNQFGLVWFGLILAWVCYSWFFFQKGNETKTEREREFK